MAMSFTFRLYKRLLPHLFWILDECPKIRNKTKQKSIIISASRLNLKKVLRNLKKKRMLNKTDISDVAEFADTKTCIWSLQLFKTETSRIKVLIGACNSNNFHKFSQILKVCLIKYPKTTKFFFGKDRIDLFTPALKNANFKLYDLLVEKFGDIDTQHSIPAAVASGNVKFFKHVMRNINIGNQNFLPPNLFTLTDRLEMFIFARENNHPKVDTAIGTATEKGNLNLVKGLIKEGFVIPTNVLDFAAKSGNVEMLKYFFELGFQTYTVNTCANAAGVPKNEGLECLKWLRCEDNVNSSNQSSVRTRCFWNSGVTLEACKNGNLKVLKWICSPDRKGGSASWSSVSAEIAANNSHFKCLKYVYENALIRVEFHTFKRLIRESSVKCLQYIYENLPAIDKLFGHDEFTNEIDELLRIKPDKKCYKYLQFFHSIGFSYTEEHFKNAIQYDKVKCFKFMLNICKDENLLNTFEDVNNFDIKSYGILKAVLENFPDIVIPMLIRIYKEVGTSELFIKICERFKVDSSELTEQILINCGQKQRFDQIRHYYNKKAWKYLDFFKLVSHDDIPDLFKYAKIAKFKIPAHKITLLINKKGETYINEYINCFESKDDRACELAVQRDSYHCLKVLRKNGYSWGENKDKLMKYAIYNKNDIILEYLHSKGEDPIEFTDDLIDIALIEKSIDCLEYLLDKSCPYSLSISDYFSADYFDFDCFGELYLHRTTEDKKFYKEKSVYCSLILKNIELFEFLISNRRDITRSQYLEIIEMRDLVKYLCKKSKVFKSKLSEWKDKYES